MPTNPQPPPTPSGGSSGGSPGTTASPGSNYILQSRADYADAELAKEGVRFSPKRLVQGARDRLTLAKNHLAALSPAGFDQPWLDAMTTAVSSLAGTKGTRDNTGVQREEGVHTEGAALHDLVDWVRGYQRGVKIAPRAIRDIAPHPPDHWEEPTRIAAAVPALQEFLRAKSFNIRGMASSAFADKGDALLAAFTGGRDAHVQASDNISPAVFTMRVNTGVVAFELERLFHAAEDTLSHEDAQKFSINPLRNGRGGRSRQEAEQAQRATAPKDKPAEPPASPAAKPSTPGDEAKKS